MSALSNERPPSAVGCIVTEILTISVRGLTFFEHPVYTSSSYKQTYYYRCSPYQYFKMFVVVTYFLLSSRFHEVLSVGGLSDYRSIGGNRVPNIRPRENGYFLCSLPNEHHHIDMVSLIDLLCRHLEIDSRPFAASRLPAASLHVAPLRRDTSHLRKLFDRCLNHAAVEYTVIISQRSCHQPARRKICTACLCYTPYSFIPSRHVQISFSNLIMTNIGVICHCHCTAVAAPAPVPRAISHRSRDPA